MSKVSIEEAIKNMEYNQARAKQYPDKQKEFADEYRHANPNDFNEMLELYTFYGYQYSWSLWAYQQARYEEANEATKRRLQND